MKFILFTPFLLEFIVALLLCLPPGILANAERSYFWTYISLGAFVLGFAITLFIRVRFFHKLFK